MDESKPHVILIAYYFPPDQVVGGLRPFRFYKYLTRLGYTCHVITTSEPSKDDPNDVTYLPDESRLNWERWKQEPLSLLGLTEVLIRKYFFPGGDGIIWSLNVAARCRQIKRAHPKNRFVVFTTFPPHGVVFAGLIVGWRERIPWICDWRDPMHTDREDTEFSRFALYLNRRLEALSFRRAAAVIANSELMAEVWRNRHPSARPKISVIYNGFDPDDEVPAPLDIQPQREKVILHAGSLYLGRNANLVIASLLRLRQRRAPEVQSVCLQLVGFVEHFSGQDSDLIDAAQREGLVKLAPAVSRQEAQRMTAESDGLLLLQPQRYKAQVPAKLFEYVLSGRPILAQVPRCSTVQQILDKAGVPVVCVYPDDAPEEVDRKLLEFLRLPSRPTRCSEWFRDNFNAEYQARQLASIIAGIT